MIMHCLFLEKRTCFGVLSTLSLMHSPYSQSTIHCVSDDLARMAAAGANTSGACIPCGAGTYQTGSGWMLLRLFVGRGDGDCVLYPVLPVYSNPTIIYPCSTKPSMLHWSDSCHTGSTGATSSGACILCQAGTYQTGSGCMQR